MQALHTTLTLSALLTLLGACGAPGQDTGTAYNLAGLAVDGYVAGANVYLDINANGVWDDYEAHALTDSEGHFGVSRTGTNYCSSSDPDLSKHCLRTGRYSSELLRIEGGIDTLTGVPFQGVLTKAPDGTDSQYTTPLTSLLGSMSTTQATAWLAAENSAATTTLALADLNSNHLSISTATTTNQNHLIRTAWLLHKSAAIIATELKRRYTDANPANAALANDFSPYVYNAMVATWEGAGNPDLQTFLNTGANITATVTEAVNLLAADGAVNDGGAIAADLGTRLADLVSLIDHANLFNLGTTTGLSATEVAARGRAIKVLTIMLSQAALSGNEAAAITDLTSPATLSNLGNSAVDLAQVAADYIATGVAATDYSGRPQLGTALGSAGINDSTPTTFSDGSGGTAGVTIDTGTGTVQIDVAAIDIDGDGINDTVSLPGTLTAINDYTSVMTLEVMGSQQTVILTTDLAGNLILDTSTMTLEGVDLGAFTL